MRVLFLFVFYQFLLCEAKKHTKKFPYLRFSLYFCKQLATFLIMSHPGETKNKNKNKIKT